MRRLLVVLLVLPLLLLVACGDNESGTAGGTDTAAETQAQTAAAAPEESATGCRKVAEPEPKEEPGKRKRPAFRVKKGTTYTAVIATNCGTVEIKLASGRAPKTASAFVALVREGFYDSLIFHRVPQGFVAQGGDPLGVGLGGPGFKVTEAPPQNLRYTKGVVAMAKGGNEAPGTSGSQFFIVTGPDAGLPPEYALLGRVSKGMDVVDRIGSVPVESAPPTAENPAGTDSRPVEPVVMEKVTIRTS